MIKNILAFTCAIGLAGCASIDVYKNEDLSGKPTGITYYSPKPYVLISRTGAKDKPASVEVIYLPDLENPRYAVMRGGIGSSELGLTFSNGVLVSANQKSDPKLVEAITALSGIPGALASAAKTRAETDELREESGDLTKAASIASQAANDLRALAQLPAANLAFTQSQRADLVVHAGVLESAAADLNKPAAGEADAKTALSKIEGVRSSLAEIKPSQTPTGSQTGPWNQKDAIVSRLDEAIAELKPKAPKPPEVTLYEIQMENGRTSLVEVPISKLEDRIQ